MRVTVCKDTGGKLIYHAIMSKSFHGGDSRLDCFGVAEIGTDVATDVLFVVSLNIFIVFGTCAIP